MSSLQPVSHSQQFPCPGCGASLEFNPHAGRLKCPYCGHESAQPLPQKQVQEHRFEQYAHRNQTQIATLSTSALEVACPGCHAELTFQPPEVAKQCPFCATPIVTQAHSASPVITPEGLLPFRLNDKAARDRMYKWIKSRWFAPNQLKKTAQHESLQGVYLPFWTYDCHTSSRYHGQRGTYYYTTETYTETDSNGNRVTKTRQVRHTRWSSASGTVARNFDDLLIPGSKTLKQTWLDQLEPWPLAELVPYDPSYLAGFKAQRYQVPLEEGFDLAKQRMAGPIERDVRRDIGGDEQRIHSLSTNYSAITFKHLLLPVWVASYRYQNKQYQVVINAQTGEVLGDRPYSVVKIALAVLAAATLVAGFFFGKMYFENPPVQESPVPAVPTQPSALPPIQSSPSNPGSNSNPSLDTAYQDAFRIATQTANLVQTAQTRQDWEKVAQGWIQAIERLKVVTANSPNFSQAQQKIEEYQRNLNYARQQIANRS